MAGSSQDIGAAISSAACYRQGLKARVTVIIQQGRYNLDKNA